LQEGVLSATSWRHPMHDGSANSLISVIMIFLDEENFIEEAIRSVFTQSYEDWELILVDDGSTDRSSQIARTYAQQNYARVRYLEHPQHENRGMSVSRNFGIRASRGKYLSFLDADDLWLSGKLHEHVNILGSHPEVALVCSPAEWWYSWTDNPEDVQRDFIQHLDVPLDTVVEGSTLLSLFLRDVWASLCDIVVRRDSVEAAGGYEDSFTGMYEDQVFHAKLCLRSTAFVSSQCWYRYRQHSDACTALHRAGAYRATRLIFLQWLKQYLSGTGGTNTEVGNVVEKELWSLRHPLLSRLSASVRCN
jgi:glycosyltransferase involved in cell wall biosynthesis